MATVNNIQVVPVQELPVSENFEGVSLPGIQDGKSVRVDFGKAIEPIANRVKALEDNPPGMTEIPDGSVTEEKLDTGLKATLAELREKGLPEVDLDELDTLFPVTSMTELTEWLQEKHTWNYVVTKELVTSKGETFTMIVGQLMMFYDTMRHAVTQVLITRQAPSSTGAQDLTAVDWKPRFYQRSFATSMTGKAMLGTGAWEWTAWQNAVKLSDLSDSNENLELDRLTADTVDVADEVTAGSLTVGGTADVRTLSAEGVSVHDTLEAGTVKAGEIDARQGAVRGSRGFFDKVSVENEVSAEIVKATKGEYTELQADSAAVGGLEAGTGCRAEGESSHAVGRYARSTGRGAVALGGLLAGYRLTGAAGAKEYDTDLLGPFTEAAAFVGSAVYDLGTTPFTSLATITAATRVKAGSWHLTLSNTLDADNAVDGVQYGIALTLAAGISAVGESAGFAGGTDSHAEGYGNNVLEAYAHGEGYHTVAGGNCSHSEGSYTRATGSAGHAEGSGAPHFYVTAKGGSKEVMMANSGIVNHAATKDVLAGSLVGAWLAHVTSDYSGEPTDLPTGKLAKILTAELRDDGNVWMTLDVPLYDKDVTGLRLHVENWGGAMGQASHTEGTATSARGACDHAEGRQTVADSSKCLKYTTDQNGAHAEGQFTVAHGAASHSEGYATQTFNEGEHASGRYNKSVERTDDNTDADATTFTVGIGTGHTARKNALDIRRNGDIYILQDGKPVLLQGNLGGTTAAKVLEALQAGKAVTDTNAAGGNYYLTADGNAVYSGDYHLAKYAVSAGERLYLNLPESPAGATCQWQKSVNVPLSPTTNVNIVGSPIAGAVDAFVQVPAGVSWLIVSGMKDAAGIVIRLEPPSAFIDMWNTATYNDRTGVQMGSYNRDTGYFELNGLTDITYAEARTIMAEWQKNQGHDKMLSGRSVYSRTNLPLCSTGASYNYYNFYAPKMEILSLAGGILYLNTTGGFLGRAGRLRRIEGTTDLRFLAADRTLMAGCSALEHAELVGLKVSVNLGGLQKLAYESWATLVEKAANTTAITVTVHKTVYDALAGTTAEDTNGGTAAQWQALREAAAAKNIAFATT